MSTTAQALRVGIPTAAAEVPGPRFGNPVSDAYVTVGCEAYIWGRHLVNIANRVPVSPGCRTERAGSGQHHRRLQAAGRRVTRFGLIRSDRAEELADRRRKHE